MKRWLTSKIMFLALTSLVLSLALLSGCNDADTCETECADGEACIGGRCRAACLGHTDCAEGLICFAGYCELGSTRPGGDAPREDGRQPGDLEGDPTGDPNDSICGNGNVEPQEACEQGVSESCVSFGYAGVEQAVCMETCMAYDLSACTGEPTTCGNNGAQNLEQCDGTDLEEQSCETLGFAGGTLSCYANCSFDVSGCELP